MMDPGCGLYILYARHVSLISITWLVVVMYESICPASVSTGCIYSSDQSPCRLLFLDFLNLLCTFLPLCDHIHSVHYAFHLCPSIRKDCTLYYGWVLRVDIYTYGYII